MRKRNSNPGSCDSSKVESIDNCEAGSGNLGGEATPTGGIEEIALTEESLRTLWLEILNSRNYFNWNDFFYALFLGLAPSAWDISTDFHLAKSGSCSSFCFGSS